MEIHLLIPVAGLLMLTDAAGRNEGKVNLSAKDIRCNQKRNVLYAMVLSVPSTNVSLKLPGKKKENARIKNIKVPGSKEKLSWKQYPGSLVVQNLE